MNNKLRTCDDCGEKVSKRAASCPYCGAPQESLDKLEDEKRILLGKRQLLLEKKRLLELHDKQKEQDLIDERRHEEWDKISKKHQNKNLKSKSKSFIYRVLSKKIFWKFNLISIIIITFFLGLSFLNLAEFIWNFQISEQYVKNYNRIHLNIDKYINSDQYSKAIKVIDYYQDDFFSHASLSSKRELLKSKLENNIDKNIKLNQYDKATKFIRFHQKHFRSNESLIKKIELVEKRSRIYKEFKEKYINLSSLTDAYVWLACIDLKIWHSKGFLEKEFLDSQIEVQKRAIKNLMRRIEFDESNVFLIKISYEHLNKISNNAYSDEYNLWKNQNKDRMEKVRKRNSIYWEQCKLTRTIQSALSSAYYPTSGVPYANFCANFGSSEDGPSDEEPCNYYMGY
mgnify:CR=1 FL=1